MRIYTVPYYCGGRILAGLYNGEQAKHKIPGYCYEQATSRLGAAGSGDIDPFPYVPNSLIEFQQILKVLLYVANGQDAGVQGVVYAVTNISQTLATGYLAKTGFDKAGEFRKHSSYTDCITWVGDYRNKIFPILKDVPDFKKPEVRNEGVFSRPAASAQPTTPWERPVPNSAPEPLQMPDAVRSSQEQMVRPLYRR